MNREMVLFYYLKNNKEEQIGYYSADRADLSLIHKDIVLRHKEKKIETKVIYETPIVFPIKL